MESIPSENVCYPAKLAHGHLEWLLDKGITTIFYPCVSYEQKAFEASDNHFNCPVVAFYPQVIEKNLDRLREPGVRYLAPFVNLANPGKLAERLVEIFEKWDVTLDEAREAVRLGFEEDAQVKADIAAEPAKNLYASRRASPAPSLPVRPAVMAPSAFCANSRLRVEPPPLSR